jgi:DNA-binding NarL/FixJ family response regulator
MRAVSVLVYSAQRMFCTALADSLDDEVHQVCAVVGRADDLRVAARGARPDICAIDVGAGDRAAYRLFEAVRSECPDTHIVVLTSSADASLWRAYDAGLVDAVVSKIHGLDTIRTSIDRAALGERFALASARPAATPRPAHVSLTAREREILRLLAHGATTRQIMAALTISPNTLRTHVQHLLNKLHAHTRAQAVQAAVKARLLVESDEVVS